MKRNYGFLIIAVLIISLACSNNNTNWQQLIPNDTPIVIIPEKSLSLKDVDGMQQIALLDDITPGNVLNVKEIEERALTSQLPSRLSVEALFLYPANSTELEPVWVTKGPEDYITHLSDIFYKTFEETVYNFNGVDIYRLFVGQNEIYSIQLNDWIFFSESSYALENVANVFLSQKESFDFNGQLNTGDFIINIPFMKTWVKQVTKVLFHPAMNKLFDGSSFIVSSFENNPDEDIELSYKGQFNVGSAPEGLARSISGNPAEITLDRHISTNAAAFAILRDDPNLVLDYRGDTSRRLDSLLNADPEYYRELASSLNEELGFVSFAESGLSNTGEYLYLRKIETLRSFKRDLDNLAEGGFIQKQNGSYFIQSYIMAQLLGSELCDFSDFYLSFSSDVAAIAKRKGLAESVNADRQRRRVIFYDNTYANYQKKLTSELSALIWIKSSSSLSFLKPYLNPGANLSALFSQFDVANMTFTSRGNQVDFSLNTLKREEDNLPFQELWVFPIAETDLTSSPILADVAGSDREEVLFATTSGSIYALAIDGTQVLQLSTNEDEPIGSPIIYDWYGNNQKVILQAAGNKIYAWNTAGTLLPKFPFELESRITAPITIDDVMRNGIPEIIVATEDRKIHVLNGRGTNVNGWPQTTNSAITSQPAYFEINGEYSIWAVSANGLFSWYRNGFTRTSFPYFAEAPFTTKPVKYKENVIAPTADGQIFSFGLELTFEDSLSDSLAVDSLIIQQLKVDDSQITGLTIKLNTLLKDSTRFYREDVFISSTLSGALFFNGVSGNLRFTESMGQAANTDFQPFVTDINSNQVEEVFALADFGRLYAWEYLTGERVYNIPTSAIKHPFVFDINGDGTQELIALTREGVRCWTIRKETDL